MDLQTKIQFGFYSYCKTHKIMLMYLLGINKTTVNNQKKTLYWTSWTLKISAHNTEMDAIHYVSVFNCSKNLEILPGTALWYDSKQHLRLNCCWPILTTTQAVVYLSCLNYFLYTGILNMVVLHNNRVTSKSLHIEVVLVAGHFPHFFSFAFLRKKKHLSHYQG